MMFHRFRLSAIAVTCICMGLGIGVARASTFKTLADITGSGDGSAPASPLIAVAGKLYGTAPSSGSAGCGVVYRFDPATSQEVVIYGFKGGADGCAPQAALLERRGLLYGTTQAGGTAGCGTVFSLDPGTATETVLHSFAGDMDGASPAAALIAVNGSLYGTTAAGGPRGTGTVFAVDLQSGVESVVHAFRLGHDAANPKAALLQVGGTLYGTSEAGGASHEGTVFAIDVATGKEIVAYSFAGAADGAQPVASLIAINGVLYGTTSAGGTGGGAGTVFSFDPATSTQHTIASFDFGKAGQVPQSALTEIHGRLYGTAASGGQFYFGTLFSVDPNAGRIHVVHAFGGGNDVANPLATIVNLGGTLYGPASTGGSVGAGGIYAIPLSGGAETVPYSFNGADNRESNGGFTRTRDGLFAAIAQGGAASGGEILSVDTTSGTVRTVSSLQDKEGRYPSAALLGGRTILYGTAKQGGAYGAGSIYSVDPSNGAIRTVYSFTGQLDGGFPYAPLVRLRGNFYGTTVLGGAVGVGVVFKFDPRTGKQTVLYSFSGGNDGGEPFTGLTVVGDKLYGSTARGGSDYSGVLFSIDPATGAETTLYTFTGQLDGSVPTSTLLDVGGVLYGTGLFGGASGYGVLFAFDPATGTQTVLYSFTGGQDGNAPDTEMVPMGRFLYGTTSGLFGGHGTVFRIDPATGALHTLHSFSGGADGGNPDIGLVAVGGTLYGADGVGGAADLGTVFSLRP